MIFAHNHASRVAEPSRADEVLMQTLKSALSQVEIKTLDHFIVAGTRTVSFAERGAAVRSHLVRPLLMALRLAFVTPSNQSAGSVRSVCS